MIEFRQSPKGRLLAMSALALGLLFGADASAADAHKLALYVTANDPAKMDLTLSNAANVSRHFSGLGEDVDIVIVGFGPGVSMFLSDRSPVIERLKGFGKSMPNVRFEACNSSVETIAQREKKRPPLMDGVPTVESGVAELLDLSEKGYTVIKP
jgi:uncharacterized protein